MPRVIKALKKDSFFKFNRVEDVRHKSVGWDLDSEQGGIEVKGMRYKGEKNDSWFFEDMSNYEKNKIGNVLHTSKSTWWVNVWVDEYEDLIRELTIYKTADLQKIITPELFNKYRSYSHTDDLYKTRGGWIPNYITEKAMRERITSEIIYSMLWENEA